MSKPDRTDRPLLPDDLDGAVAAMMHAAWREPGFCVPNHEVYPHQWLWDSCFHSLVWLGLGRPERALTEVLSALSAQDGSGFVPHMVYHRDPDAHADFWGRPGSSVITQPPMYGHALAEVMRFHRSAGTTPDAGRMQAAAVGAELGLAHLLLDRDRTADGLVPVYHPWETGCDDSLRWDHWLPADDGDDTVGGDRVRVWRTIKAALVADLDRSPTGHATGSRSFAAGSVGFNALVAWNATELMSVFPETADRLATPVARLVRTLENRWNGTTWVDDGPHTDGSGRARTLDALLVVLVDPRTDAFEQLTDPASFGALYGPRGAHPDESGYRSDVYWRGPAWPQLTYLLMVAASRADRPDVASALADNLASGAAASGLAEYWDPDTGRGLGAVPQTWAGLAALATAFTEP